MRTLLLGLFLVGSTAAAQDARLVLRDAAFAAGQPGGVAVDTDGWEAVVHDGQVLRLGDVVQALDEGSVLRASLAFDSYTHEPMISMELSPAAADAFSEVTASRVGRLLAMVLDGEVLMAPTINQRIEGGQIQVTGAFTVEETRSLVASILEATGAVDARRLRIEQVREALDRSTPEATVRSFLAAMAAGDSRTVAALLHPALVSQFLEGVVPDLEVSGDSVRMRLGPLGDDEALWQPIAGYVDFTVPEGGLGALSDIDAVALALAVTGMGARTSQAMEVVGSVQGADWTVHVVVRPEAPRGMTEMRSPGFDDSAVLSVQRVEGEWGVLMPESGW